MNKQTLHDTFKHLRMLKMRIMIAGVILAGALIYLTEFFEQENAFSLSFDSHPLVWVSVLFPVLSIFLFNTLLNKLLNRMSNEKEILNKLGKYSGAFMKSYLFVGINFALCIVLFYLTLHFLPLAFGFLILLHFAFVSQPNVIDFAQKAELTRDQIDDLRKTWES